MNTGSRHAYKAPAWADPLAVVPRERIRLAQLPTPIEAWSPSDIADGFTLSLLRDDLTGSALSGNKVRKLEFLLADALRQGCDTVLTCGGIQSNHCRATAVAARQLGLDPVLFLRTSTPDTDPGLVGNLLLDRVVGAGFRLITPEEYRRRDELMEESAEVLRRKGKRPYLVPEGGSNPLGSWGYIQAAAEMMEGPAFAKANISDVVVPMGSGGTAAGLALGLHLAGHAARVHAVNVCDDAAYFYARINEIFAGLGTDATAEERVDVMDGHVGLGYALPRKEELQRLCRVGQDTGIILDPVYTGKAFNGLVTELNTNPSRFRGSRILFVHTGGLFGLYQAEEQLASIL